MHGLLLELPTSPVLTSSSRLGNVRANFGLRKLPDHMAAVISWPITSERARKTASFTGH